MIGKEKKQNRFLHSLCSVEMTESGKRSVEMTRSGKRSVEMTESGKRSVEMTGIALVLAMMVVLGFVGCKIEVGLGEALDLVPPRVSITSHDDNVSVANVFTLQGVASDNEAVDSLTIDIGELDMHWEWSEKSGWLKKVGAGSWGGVDETKANSRVVGKNVNWSVVVEIPDDGSEVKDIYSVRVVVTDAMGNSSKNSVAERSLRLDMKDPIVWANTMSSGELLSGTVSEIQTRVAQYGLKDGSCITRLTNGNFSITGRQTGATIFNEMRLEIDDGALDVGVSATRKKTEDKNPPFSSGLTCEKIANEISFDGDNKTQIFCTKTQRLKSFGGDKDDLRNWEFKITPEDLASVPSGKQLLRIVTTSLSSSERWERKVLGYFVWWPESDTPWLEVFNLDDEDRGNSTKSVYPASRISGYAQDDDGIKNLTYKLYKKDATQAGGWSFLEENNNETFTDFEKGATYVEWRFKAPQENGIYKVEVEVEDVNGTKGAKITQFFKTMDIQAPRLEISTPDGSSAFGDASGNITLSGEASDDGELEKVMFVHLNPSIKDPQNKIQYKTNDNLWKVGTDAAGNKVFEIPLTAVSSEKTVYTFFKTYNIFTDFGINGSTKKLETQQFVFRVTDANRQSTTRYLTLQGDVNAPSISIDSITINSGGTAKLYNLSGENVPSLPKFAPSDTAVLKGTWSDDSVKTHWSDKNKIGAVKINWNQASYTATRNNNGTWQLNFSSPLPSEPTALISAEISDYGGNTKNVHASFYIESADASFDRISSENDDGSYKAGDVIIVTMEFNKSVTFSGGNPSLALNLGNGKTATYLDGNGSPRHRFSYTVQAGDNVSKLDVTSMNTARITYKDTSSQKTVSVTTLPQGSKSLKGGRNIGIDTVLPTIKSVTTSVASGYYKADATINVVVEFSENVSITNVSQIKLNFNNSIQSTETSSSGSNLVISYTVASGQNASPLSITASSLSLGSAVIKDAAGNVLSTSTIPSASVSAFNTKNIVIDTTSPATPTVTISPNKSAVYDSTGVSITVSGESGATLEYSIDNGKSWQTYTAAKQITQNGDYSISARQTDRAGNKSGESAVKNVKVEMIDILKSISAETLNGTYKTGDVIQGTIEFNKEVTLPSGANVTLNIKNGSTNSKNVAISTATQSLKTHKFSYTVVAGDSIANDGLLDVTSFSFSNVTVTESSVSVGVSLPASGSGKRFNEMREIHIVTANPQVTDVSITGEDENAKLEITFNREISKGVGDIILTQSNTDFKVPAVLSAQEYGELSQDSDAIRDSYLIGINGAEKVSNGSGGYKAKQDTKKKYVLNYTIDTDNTNLVSAFKASGKNVVRIGVYSSSVTIPTSAKNKLVVSLTGAFKIPVKGASYSISIPAGIVNDAYSNTSIDYSTTKTAPGVEKPVIRINKQRETISGGVATQPYNVTYKIDCRTPGVTLQYRKQERESGQIEFGGDSGYTVVEPTADVAFPSGSYNNYTLKQSLNVLASPTNKTGRKVIIEAKATLGSFSEISYEYATRSVLIFRTADEIEAATADGSGGKSKYINNATSGVYHDVGNMGSMSMWVRGGDSPEGGNSTPNYPLSWNQADYSGIRIMSGMSGNGWTDNSEDLKGEWYWMSWEISKPTYHGFILGNVPSDAATNGPKAWVWASCSWTALKTQFALYPGETLKMNTLTYNKASGLPEGQINNQKRGWYSFKYTKDFGCR